MRVTFDCDAQNMCACCSCMLGSNIRNSDNCFCLCFAILQEKVLQLLERRIEAVQSVLQYLDARSHDAHAGLSFEEYEVCWEYDVHELISYAEA